MHIHVMKNMMRVDSMQRMWSMREILYFFSLTRIQDIIGPSSNLNPTEASSQTEFSFQNYLILNQWQWKLCK